MDDRSTSAALDGRDAPGVLLPPPLIPVAMLAVGVALQRVAPLHVLSQVPLSVRVGAGAAAALAGVCTTVLGVRALARGGTNVSPYMPSLAMVTSGVYARTRNPIYVYARLAGIAATAAALPCGIEQKRATSRARPGHLHLQARPHRRSRARGPAISRFGLEPCHRRNRLLELDISPRCRRPHAR